MVKAPVLDAGGPLLTPLRLEWVHHGHGRGGRPLPGPRPGR